MMMILKFAERKFLRAKFEQQPSRGKAYKYDLFHSTLQKNSSFMTGIPER